MCNNPDLDSARGIINAIILSGIFWALIALLQTMLD
jgi:hypothetical protein